jgi:hypothetical protein
VNDFGLFARRYFVGAGGVGGSQIQFCSWLGGFGDKRRDWLECAIQFHFESILLRRGHVV